MVVSVYGSKIHFNNAFTAIHLYHVCINKKKVHTNLN